MSFFSHLECTACNTTYSPDQVLNICTKNGCGKPLFAIYQPDAAINRDQLAGRIPSLWRYREMLPAKRGEPVISLGEGFTPLIRAERLGQSFGLKALFIKDESLNPTGSFKARGLAVAISRAKALGIRKCAIPTAGNAGGALSAYCAAAGMEAHVFMPADTPPVFRQECEFFGASVTLVDGLITDCGKIVQERKTREGWFDVSTLKEPYRVEGKKTMGYELAEQMAWNLPDVILYPTGGGTGLIGMWKAFDEMEHLGWIGPARPRMISIQMAGCAPIVRAFESGAKHADFFENAQTIVSGLRVPQAIGDFLILKAIRESRGTAIAVSDQEAVHGVHKMAENEGIFAAPEGGAVIAALEKLVGSKGVSADERIVLFNTGSAYKYIDQLS